MAILLFLLSPSNYTIPPYLQSKQADQVLDMNALMIEKYNQMKLELSIAQSGQHESAERLSMYQTTIKSLNRRIAAEQAQFDQSRQEIEAVVATRVSIWVGDWVSKWVGYSIS